jgi:hypothetical protein
MMIFLDESGDLGWSLDKPYLGGGSSRFLTIAGIVIEKAQIKDLLRDIQELYFKYRFRPRTEVKGYEIPDLTAMSIVNDLLLLSSHMPFQIISITADKRNVNPQLRRDSNVFYNHMLNNLLADQLKNYNDIEIILDDRTTKSGSRNSFEDCLRAKCWGELGLNTNVSCRFEESHKNRGICLADWLANFIWRHYENNTSNAYMQCTTSERFHERKLFM